MRLQLIFVVESDSRSKTDWIYIKESLEKYYVYRNSYIKLSPVYMGGKGNYRKKESEVKQLMDGRINANSTAHLILRAEKLVSDNGCLRP